MPSTPQTQINDIQPTVNAQWPLDIDFSSYLIIDALGDSIPEATELSFEEPEAAKLFDEAFSVVDSIQEAAEVFDEAFSLVGTFQEAAGLSFELEAAELFEKFCFADSAPEAAELSSEEPCPQAQSTNVETQDPPAEDSRLTGEASHDSSDDGGPTCCQAGSNGAQPSDQGVPAVTATEIDKESQKIIDQFRFLRYKLQTGLLTEVKNLKRKEIRAMSLYLEKLESFHSPPRVAITTTKMHKVLKAIKKLDKIPRDDEFCFKKRATELLGKWKVILDHEESPLTPSIAKPQSERPPEPLVIDLTELSESELPASVQKVRMIESLSPQTSSDEMASCAGVTSKSSHVSGAASSARKRKRSKVGGHSNAISSDSSTRPTRVKTPIRRQTRPKTSVQTYARDESLRIKRELKQIDEMLQENTQEMQMVKVREAKMLEEIAQEMELVQRKKARILEENSEERELIQRRMAGLTGFKERMLAWDAHDQMVTEEWEHSR